MTADYKALLKRLAIFIVLTSIVSSPAAFAQTSNWKIPQLDSQQAEWIGQRIFANECNLKLPCLTSWNTGEDFPSLGIGHFIWYRHGQHEVFVESFPALISYYQQKEVWLPHWLTVLPGIDSPWASQEEFYRGFDGPDLTSLRQFLHDTMPVQVEFIIERLYASVPELRKASAQPDAIEDLFTRIAHTELPHGMYALIDYVNFKGEGTASSERYQNQGWGLLQVLEHMLAQTSQEPLLNQFADAAKAVLARRVQNSPPQRDEARWTNGWNNRADTYRSTR